MASIIMSVTGFLAVTLASFHAWRVLSGTLILTVREVREVRAALETL